MSLVYEHIKKISDEYTYHLSEDNKKYLYSLKKTGFEPDVIYDIGAGALIWTRFCETLWPNAKYIVFDAFSPFEELYKEFDYDYYIGALSDFDEKTVKFYQNEFFFFQNSYYREVSCECINNYDIDDYVEMTTASLNTICKKRDFPEPDLVHIDVQGAEKDVIIGGNIAISTAQRLIVNMHHEECKVLAPRVYQIFPVIFAQGWRCDAPIFSDNGSDGDYGFYKNI